MGPRAQAFKKSTYSSSGSGGFMHFGLRRGPCAHCGKNHVTNQCPQASGACFKCGKTDHIMRDCPQKRGVSGSGSQGSQATVQQRTHGQSVGSSNLQPRAQGQVFALNQDQTAKENERVIACTFLLCGIPAFVVIDTGASHSFVSARFVKRNKLPYVSLDVRLSVSTPVSHSVVAKGLLLGCPLDFEGSELIANLVILEIDDF